PTIVLVVNRPELFTPNYERFLLNRFREELPFPEVPIKLLVRGRKRDEQLGRPETYDTAPGADEALLDAEIDEALADLTDDDTDTDADDEAFFDDDDSDGADAAA